jgi:hypothetical protein
VEIVGSSDEAEPRHGFGLDYLLLERVGADFRPHPLVPRE